MYSIPEEYTFAKLHSIKAKTWQNIIYTENLHKNQIIKIQRILKRRFLSTPCMCIMLNTSSNTFVIAVSGQRPVQFNYFKVFKVSSHSVHQFCRAIWVSPTCSSISKHIHMKLLVVIKISSK